MWVSLASSVDTTSEQAVRRPRSTSRRWRRRRGARGSRRDRRPPQPSVRQSTVEPDWLAPRSGRRRASAAARRGVHVDLVRLEGVEPVGRDEERRQDDEARRLVPSASSGARARASRPTSPHARGSGRSPGSSPARSAGGSTTRAAARGLRGARSARRRPSSTRVLAGLRDRPQHGLASRPYPWSACLSGEAPRGRLERLTLGAELDARLDPHDAWACARELALELSVEQQPAIGVDREELTERRVRARHDGALRERDRAPPTRP